MTIDTLKQSALADLMADAAIRYSNGHATDWQEVAKQALAAITPSQAASIERLKQSALDHLRDCSAASFAEQLEGGLWVCVGTKEAIAKRVGEDAPEFLEWWAANRLALYAVVNKVRDPDGDWPLDVLAAHTLDSLSEAAYAVAEKAWGAARATKIAAAAQPDLLVSAMEDAISTLGRGPCSMNKCDGCRYEMSEAHAILVAALATPPQAKEEE